MSCEATQSVHKDAQFALAYICFRQSVSGYVGRLSRSPLALFFGEPVLTVGSRGRRWTGTVMACYGTPTPDCYCFFVWGLSVEERRSSRSVDAGFTHTTGITCLSLFDAPLVHSISELVDAALKVRLYYTRQGDAPYTYVTGKDSLRNSSIMSLTV